MLAGGVEVPEAVGVLLSGVVVAMSVVFTPRTGLSEESSRAAWLSAYVFDWRRCLVGFF